MYARDKRVMSELIKWDEKRITKTGLNLPEGLPFETWEEYVKQARFISNVSLWIWGDLIRYGERNYGEMYAQALEESDYSYSGLTNAVYVCDKFEIYRRRENLPISFHQEVAGVEDTEEQDKLLDDCEKNQWTQKELRREVRKLKKRQTAEDAGPLPEGKFDVIYCDPPWEYDNTGFLMSAEKQYPTMSTEDLQKLEVKNIYDDNCVLFMWATNPLLVDALSVMRSWGFIYKTNFVWVKNNHTAGFYVFGKHELLLIGVKGSMLPEKKFKSIISGDNIVHSKKPEILYQMIEKMYPNSRYVELFARNKRENWESWGNEV